MEKPFPKCHPSDFTAAFKKHSYFSSTSGQKTEDSFTRQDWVHIPDLLYVSYDRLAVDWPEDGPCPVAPELVIEIPPTKPLTK
jgi:hypothetical protein